MREKNLKWLSLILVLVVSYAVLNVAHAPGCNVYVDPPENVYNPGDTFTVDINVADVVDLYSWGIKVSWERDLLEAIDVTEGPFLELQPEGTHFVKVIHDDYVDIGCSTLGAYYGLGGSGTLMTITFEVLDAGKTSLEIFYSVLIDHQDVEPPVEISHTVTDGYFETPQAANLVKKSAWPEHHHFDISKDEAFNGTHANQTLFGIVKNIGPVGYNLTVYVAFEIVRSDGVVGMPMSDAVTVTPGSQVDLTADFLLSDLDVGKYYVSASCWYSYNGTYWAQGEKVKTFSFAVVS